MTTPHPPGATLHLGGHAYAHPDLEPLIAPIQDVTPFPGNPRRHDQDNITGSVRDHGLYQGVTVQQSTGHVVVGNGRLQALLDLGATRVPVTRVDVDDTRARAIVARDNQTSDASTNDEALLLDLLAPLASDPDLLALSGFTEDDLTALAAVPPEPVEGPVYTRKADPIHYEPTMDAPPPVSDLVDRGKANDLVRQISEADVPADVRDFLIAGAQRHLTFRYDRIAEFYAHATPEVQALMEASALVIVDYEDAIHHGFVRLSARLREILDEDLTERSAIDAAGVTDGA